MVYQPNTADQLGHYFGNQISGFRIARQMGLSDPEDPRTVQRKFVEGIELTIQRLSEGVLVETEGIGEPQLRKILDVVRDSDLSQPENLRKVHKVYSEITGREFSEDFYKNIK